MKEHPKITIITPVYNVKDYLAECINSVINQSYKEIEFFLIDDGSNDGSEKICDEYAKKDNRITVIHKHNEGQGVARNVAIECMTGDYVLFVDSDDYLEKDAIQKMISSMKETTDLLCCNYKVNNGIKSVEVEMLNENRFIEKNELFELYLDKNQIFTGPVCKLIRSSIMKQIKFPRMRCNEDVYILHEVFDKCKEIFLCKECFYTIRIRKDSTEHKPFSHAKMNLILACDQVEAYTAKHYPEYMNSVLKNRLNSIYSLLTSIVKSKDIKGNLADYQWLIKEFRKTFEQLENIEEEKYIRLYRDESLFIKDVRRNTRREKTKQFVKNIIFCLKRKR